MDRDVSLGGNAETVGSLGRGGGVKALRGTARAASGDETRRLSVEDLKNGGTIDFSGLLPEDSPAPATGSTIRQRYLGSGHQPRASAKQTRNQGLSEAERLQKLSEIKKSATDYETMFVDFLVKQMRPSPLTRTPGRDTFIEIAEQPFRNFLSQAGGLGLADSLVGQIARQEGLEQTLHEHPEVMGPAYRPTIPKSLKRSVPPGLSKASGPGREAEAPAAETDPA